MVTMGGRQLWADRRWFMGYRIQRNVLTMHYRLLGRDDVRLAWGSLNECERVLEQIRVDSGLQTTEQHLVVLLHGLFRAKDAMGPLRRGLRSAGFIPAALNYPSTRRSLTRHAEQIEDVLNNLAVDPSLASLRQVSFVTHSMGGLVARTLLGRPDAPWRQRLVPHRLLFIATPNQGSTVARELGRSQAFHLIAGPGASQLTPERAHEVPPPNIPFGIIAGVRGDQRGYNPLLDGDDDMTVAKASTRLPGAEDVLDVKAVHTFVMRKAETVDATIRYLNTGSFR
ncbi:MAG: pimeloyl-ACP methyl ester carboxylesterase [Kiritimatiellia bacterium]|jgi:pimeloyl-ACP methyl ester carboxylesterase